jgi:GT2 family glycosyltransferase
VPQSRQWLKELTAPLADGVIAAVHGKESPIGGWCGYFEWKVLSDSFGEKPRTSASGHFFSNANSAIPRELLLAMPFDEKAGWAEDQLWAHEAQKRGYAIRYQPTAEVAHSHNLSMRGNFARCLKFHRAMFATVWRGRHGEIRSNFRARLAQRSVSFRKFLLEKNLMGFIPALFYAPYCEFVNYLGCREAAREAATMPVSPGDSGTTRNSA